MSAAIASHSTPALSAPFRERLTRSRRAALERWIASAIDLLDDIDDVDRENGEPQAGGLDEQSRPPTGHGEEPLSAPRDASRTDEADIDMEGQIMELRRAAGVAQLLFESVLDYAPAKRPPAWLKLEHLAPAGQLAFIITEEGFAAVDYAVSHLVDLARRLDADYRRRSEGVHGTAA